MATINEIAYLIYDELGLGSDDERFNINHIYFLVDKWRTILLNQRYIQAKKSIPISNYQEICLDIEYDYDCKIEGRSNSIQSIPNLVNLNGETSLIISPVGDQFNNINFSYINNERFSYVGNNKWLRKFIYFTIGKDRRLYLTSSSSDYKYLSKVTLNGVFSDTKEAYKLSCNKDNIDCNYYDSEYPLEETLIPPIINAIVQELSGPIYRPEDDKNNASDDLSGLGITK